MTEYGECNDCGREFEYEPGEMPNMCIPCQDGPDLPVDWVPARTYTLPESTLITMVGR